MRYYLQNITGWIPTKCRAKNKNIFRNIKIELHWLLQRRKYGFDEREIYSIDTTFFLFAYEHLQMYLDIASKHIDLEDEGLKYTYENKQCSFKSYLLILLGRLKEICQMSCPWDTKYKNFTMKTMDMWNEVLPKLWW